MALASDSPEHSNRICFRDPISSSHPGSLHNPSGLDVDQLLISRSVLYLPDSILAVITALLISNGLPAVVQIGWGLVRDIKEVLKNSKESK